MTLMIDNQADAIEIRQQHVAALKIAATKMNSTPELVEPVTEALERVLEIAAACPGGQQALIHGLRVSSNAQEILAFCKAFVNVMAVAALSGVIDDAETLINPVHDMGVSAIA